jgi:hypothetical protein
MSPSAPLASRQSALTRRSQLHRAALVLAALTCALLAVIAPISRAAAQPLTATAFPAELVLAPGERGAGSLLIENSSGIPVTLTAIKAAASSPTVRVSVDRVRTTHVAPWSAVDIGFTATRTKEGFEHDVGVQFILTYKAGPTRLVTVIEETVKASPGLGLIKVALDGNAAGISQYRPADLAIVVSNVQSDPITLSHMMVTGVRSVQTTVGNTSNGPVAVDAGSTVDVLRQGPVVLGPREIRTFPVHLSIGDQVDPGSRMLLVNVDAIPGAVSRLPSRPLIHQVDTVATKTFSVQVYGEYDILNGIGAPGFLVLPGIVIAVVSVFLVAKASPWRSVVKLGADGAGVATTATATTIFGVLASLAMAKIYPELTKSLVPGVRRDYLQAYGFVDFYYLLAYALAIAAIIWALSLPVYVFGRGMLWLPVEGDGAMQLLRRLGFLCAARGNSAVPVSEVPEAGQQRLALVLKQHLNATVSVSPVIRITVLDDEGGLNTRLDAVVTHSRLPAVWRSVRRAHRDGRVAVSFAEGMISEPRDVSQSEATMTGQRRRRVELAPSSE